MCNKKKRDNLFNPGKDTCKVCEKDLKKYDSIGGIFEERLCKCNVCGEEKRLNPSNFKGSFDKNGNFAIRIRVCLDCIEREYKKLENNLQEPSIKECVKCKKLYPNSLDYFVKNYRNKDFLNKICKNCTSKSPTHKRRKIVIDGIAHHTCRECGKLKPRDEFYLCKNGKKLVKRCIECCDRIEKQIKNKEYKIKHFKCSSCGELKELNFENYDFAPDCKEYIKPTCKECQRQEYSEYRKKYNENKRT